MSAVSAVWVFLVSFFVGRAVAAAFKGRDTARQQSERERQETAKWLRTMIRPGNVQRKAPAFRFEQPAKGAKEYRQ
jgi:hypothetical protein